ncbi:MAG: 3'-5' exonuclease [Chitinophagales bacterium]|nr:3'-5' exonuclease [Chitinophagales bacterium]
MLEQVLLENALVFDIETVPGVAKFNELNEEFRKLWEIKALKQNLFKEGETLEENYQNNAGIYAEFGKVVCISVGFFKRDNTTGKLSLRVRSFADREEKIVLQQFCELLTAYFNNTKIHFLCGHNIREFDIPYLCRRMLINGIELPKLLDIGGLKPWEVLHVDTMQCWKFGDYKGYTSLRLLAAVFGIPTPKDDIDGSDVGRVFWEEDNLDRIRVYCQKDVVTTARLLLKYKGQPNIEDNDVVLAS